MNFRRITPISNLKIWFLSSFVSSAICLGIFLTAQANGLFELLITPNGSDITWKNIVSGCFMIPLLAIIFYSLLQFFFSYHLKLLRIIGYSFTVLTFAQPAQIDGVSFGEILLLCLIHVIVAVTFVEWVVMYHKQSDGKSFQKSVLDKKQISL
jgi:hypothetical protein